MLQYRQDIYRQMDKAVALTDLKVKKTKAADKPQKLADGGGMYLLIHPNGAKYWRLDYRFTGKRKTLAMGAYPDVSLSDARERRSNARKLLAGGEKTLVR